VRNQSQVPSLKLEITSANQASASPQLLKALSSMLEWSTVYLCSKIVRNDIWRQRNDGCDWMLFKGLYCRIHFVMGPYVYEITLQNAVP